MRLSSPPAALHSGCPNQGTAILLS
jgi:hypothetical protein